MPMAIAVCRPDERARLGDRGDEALDEEGRARVLVGVEEAFGEVEPPERDDAAVEGHRDDGDGMGLGVVVAEEQHAGDEVGEDEDEHDTGDEDDRRHPQAAPDVSGQRRGIALGHSA